MVAKQRKPLIVIVGPTATGKSDLSIRLAKKISGEIVSADSWVVRQEVNIGTAKPSPSDLKALPHHMINIIKPCEYYSAAIYKEDANKAIQDIFERGKTPVLVGGTGLYIDSIIYDYSFLPSPSIEQRARLSSMSIKQLLDISYQNSIDLTKIDQRNKRRIIRAIETDGAVPDKKSLREDTLVIGLGIEKDKLLERIESRVDRMLEDGLEKEVKQLSERYGWDCEALKGIGYHEWKEYFQSNQSLEDTRARIIKDTLALAKRQMTWFKRNKSIHWFDTPVRYSLVEDLITTFLNKTVNKN